MTTKLGETELARLSAFVAATLGLNFPPERWGDLERQIHLAAADVGFADAPAFIEQLLAAPLSQAQMDVLAAHLTVSETYFWREPAALEALRDTILPDLMRARPGGERQLRLWCAGCSTGEEAYSLAMVLREAVPAQANWKITLLATDINPHRLQHAALGVYSEWSFRHAPPGLKEKYFARRADGRYTVLPALRQMVTFASLNLAEDTYPALLTNTLALDVIFCRNVLMYFAMEHGQQVAQRFYRALTDGGWLMVAAAEVSERRFPQFTAVRFPGAFAYHRDGSAPPTVAPPAVAPLAVRPLPLPAHAAPAPLPPRARESQPLRPAAAAAPAGPPSGGPNVARSLANQGRLDEALAACEQALAVDKLDAALHYLHAVILTELGLDDRAKAALRRTLYLNPNFALAHVALAKMARRQGNPAAAQKSLGTALALLGAFDPGDILPEAEGLTVGRLRAMVQGMLPTGTLPR